MSENKFTWQSEVTAEEWCRVVTNSPQGTIFSEEHYLELVGCPYNRYLIRQGEHIKAGVCVTLSTDRKKCIIDDFIIHNGIIFLPDPTKKVVRQKFEQFELMQFTIEQLCAHYSHIEIVFPPQIEDMRPFLWYNYHESNVSQKFALNLRYTSYVDITDLARKNEVESTSVYQAFETLRQRHIRDALKKGGQVKYGYNGAILVDYYRIMMTKQGAYIAEEKLQRMLRIIEGLIASKKGRLYEVSNYDGDIVYLVFYAWDSKRAYYLFGAGSPEKSEPWQGTLAHFEAFVDLAKSEGIKEIDLEGINSPQRGWFKLGFGGKIVPYYQVYRSI